MECSTSRVMMLLAGLVIFSTEAFAGFCTECPLAAGKTYWLALPTTTSNLKTAEDVCSVSTNIASVQSNGRTLTCSTSSCTGGTAETGCGPSCFCIDPGDGVAVTTSGPVVVPIIGGEDDPGPITLAPGSLFSLPYQSGPLVNAEDICQAFGLAAGTRITKLNPDTGATLIHDCGNVNPFLLTDSCRNAFILTVPSAITYQNPVTPGNPPFPPCVGESGNRYCIGGLATNERYSWGIDLGKNGLNTSTEPYFGSAPPVATGESSATLAFEFAKSIEDLSFPGVTASATGSCFSISVVPPQSFDLYVGEDGADPPACKVTQTGCDYNPTITLELASVPTMSTWGLIILVVAMMAGAYFVLRRRMTAIHPTGV